MGDSSQSAASPSGSLASSKYQDAGQPAADADRCAEDRGMKRRGETILRVFPIFRGSRAEREHSGKDCCCGETLVHVEHSTRGLGGWERCELQLRLLVSATAQPDGFSDIPPATDSPAILSMAPAVSRALPALRALTLDINSLS